MKYEFEPAIRKVLEEYHFFVFTNNDFPNAVREMDYEKHIYISFVCYREVNSYDAQWISQFADATKNVYWIQFRDNSNGKWIHPGMLCQGEEPFDF